MNTYKIMKMGKKEFIKKVQSLKKDIPLDVNRKFDLNSIQKMFNMLSSAKRILVVCDYDVDGISSAYILSLAFNYLKQHRNYNFNFEVYLPNRFKDGYGLKQNIVDYAIAHKMDTIFTADNGINANEAISYAKEKGLKVIVTDHHILNGKMPNADVVINPHYTQSNLICKDVCGASTVFYIFRNEINDKKILCQMMMASGIATVADCMPLIAENRKMVSWTINQINSDYIPIYSIGYILHSEDIKNQDFDLSTIQFTIAPLLNASGRLESAELSLDLLNCKNSRTISSTYKKVSSLNQKRKRLVDDFEEKLVLKEDIINVEVISKSKVKLDGIVGLVASKMVETTGMPAFCFTESNGIYKGSGRSIEGFDLNSAVCDYLKNDAECVSYGGHAGAMGVSFKSMDGVNNFKEFVSKIKVTSASHETEVIELDGISDTEALEILNENKIFDAERPLFYKQRQIKSIFGIGNNKHSQLLTDKNENLSWFFHKPSVDKNELKCNNLILELNGKNKNNYKFFVRDLY